MFADTVVARVPVGVVRVEGDDRIDLLNRLATNDLTPLAEAGRVASTLFTTNKGRVVDWVWVLARESDLLVRTSAGRAGRVCEWIDGYTITEEVTCHDDSEAWEVVVVHGSRGAEVAGIDLPALGAVAANEHGLWIRGLDAYGPRLEALTGAATEVVAESVARGGVLAPEGVVESLRLLAGVPAAHREFATEVNPLELRLGAAAVSFDKGCFIGQEVLARMDAYDKLARVLMGFECEQRLPDDVPLKLSRGGRPLGRITSVVNAGDRSLGLGVVKREAASEGAAHVVVGEELIPVRLRDRPFWS